MKINRHTLHLLLVDYEKENSQGISYFFPRESKIRCAILALRGDFNQYDHLYEDLNESEMDQLIAALFDHINNKNMSDMSLIDNRMIHQLMCDSLLSYELDKTNDCDAYREAVYAYFTHVTHRFR